MNGVFVALYIVAAILLLPLLEIAVFIMVGGAIGILPTVLLTVATAVAGSLMLRQQGLSLIMRMQSELDSGRVPADDIMHGAMIVLASILLLIPGFVTDAVGLLLFIPPIRSAIARFIVARSNVVIVQNGNLRQGDGRVVDLDEDDWSAKSPGEERGADSRANQSRISPWSSDDRGR